MFHSLFLKHTIRVCQCAAFVCASNLLSAQGLMHPLSIDFSWIAKNAIQTKVIETEAVDNQKNTSLTMTARTDSSFGRNELIAAEINPLTQLQNNKVEDNTFQDSTCVDLRFDSVSVVKITEKYIEIEYSIINRGTAPAPIFGTKRSNTDNVAVHFYFSGTQRLTRGSILAEGIYLTEGLHKTKGWLAPNVAYKNRLKLSLEKKNRFYGVIILQLDAFDVMRHECDETNNIFAIVPKWY